MLQAWTVLLFLTQSDSKNNWTQTKVKVHRGCGRRQEYFGGGRQGNLLGCFVANEQKNLEEKRASWLLNYGLSNVVQCKRKVQIPEDKTLRMQEVWYIDNKRGKYTHVK